VQTIAQPFGLSVEETALGIIRLANSNMDNLLRVISVRRGYDPREFCLVAFGGGGSMHATALARRLRVKKVIVPVAPAVFSAWGMLMADLRLDLVQTTIARTDRIDAGGVMDILTRLETEAGHYFQRERIEPSRVATMRFADMRYLGQEHTVKAPLPAGELTVDSFGEIEERFHSLHDQHYTFRMDDSPVEFVNFHLTAFGVVEKPNLGKLEPSNGNPAEARKGEREVDFDELGRHVSSIYDRARLGRGTHLNGPAIVEEPAASTVLFPGDDLFVDDYGNLIIEVSA
jgi:N-methylhydantoinase A